MNRFLNRAHEGVSIGPHGDLFKVLGFDGLERRDDPLDIWPRALKHQVLEFHGSREVKRSRYGQVSTSGKVSIKHWDWKKHTLEIIGNVESLESIGTPQH